MNPPPLPQRQCTVTEACARYWKRAIGMMLFPPVMFVTHEFIAIPGSLLMIVFFLVCVPAMSPYFQKKAPFGYCMMLVAGWMSSAMFGIVLLMVIRFLMGVPLEGQG